MNRSIISLLLAFASLAVASNDIVDKSTPSDSPIRQLSQPFWTTSGWSWGCYSPVDDLEHTVINSTLINFANRPFCFEAAWGLFGADDLKTRMTISMNNTESDQLVTLYDEKHFESGPRAAQVQVIASEPFRIQLDLKPAVVMMFTYAYEGTCLLRQNLTLDVMSSYQYVFENNCP